MNGSPSLLDRVRMAVRMRHYSLHTEVAYVCRSRAALRVVPRQASAAGHGCLGEDGLSGASCTGEKATASTQNQARSAAPQRDDALRLRENANHLAYARHRPEIETVGKVVNEPQALTALASWLHGAITIVSTRPQRPHHPQLSPKSLRSVHPCHARRSQSPRSTCERASR